MQLLALSYISRFNSYYFTLQLCWLYIVLLYIHYSSTKGEATIIYRSAVISLISIVKSKVSRQSY